MAGDGSLNRETVSLQPAVDPDSKQSSKKRDTKDEITNTVPLYKLFSFADPFDQLLMFLGTFGAIGNGISMPVMTLIFGNMINAFGSTTNSKEVVDEVSKVISYSSVINFCEILTSRGRFFWYKMNRQTT